MSIVHIDVGGPSLNDPIVVLCNSADPAPHVARACNTRELRAILEVCSDITDYLLTSDSHTLCKNCLEHPDLPLYILKYTELE